MKFSSTTIVPKGRTKYGEYIAAGNVTNSVNKVVYYGNNSTTEIGGGGESGTDTDSGQSIGFYMFLSKSSNDFEGTKVALSAVSDTTTVVGYRGNERVCTYLYDLDNARYATDEDHAATADTENPVDFIIQDEVVLPLNYGIQNLPASGMTVSVANNGTSATTLTITIDRTISANSGTIMIPAYVYLKEYNDMGNNAGDWFENVSDCEKMWLEYQWSVIGSADNNYVLDLTNDSAGINCDSNGTIYSGAVQYLSCQAILYYGNNPLTSGVTYGYTTDIDVSGLSMNTSTGVLYFGNNFMFEGSMLEIHIVAVHNFVSRTKTMTITKQYPGADGTGATTRWIVPSASSVKVNPNTGTISPTGITAVCMKQVNDESPVVDNSTTIYWGWDTERPNNIYNGAIPIVASYDHLALGLKNSGGIFYELETIPILEEGLNGSAGDAGQSVYRLDLTNESASINCDLNGNLLPGAVRPDCTATLYYGNDVVNNAAYSFAEDYGTGITIDSTTGVITVTTSFDWAGTSIGIVINATVNGILRGTATFTLSKNFPGENGEPAISYWLAPSANAVKVDSGGTASPSTLTCVPWKQVGENVPVQIGANEVPYIYWGYDTITPTTRYNGQSITVDTGRAYVCFRLFSNNTQYDIETIPILRDGANGSEGPQGRQGAAIRGPIEWTSQLNRRWCSGNGNASGVSMEEDYLYLDIIFKMSGDTKVYYVCNTSYTQPANASWSSVSSFWTQTDKQFEFVASRVLLAENAYIDFLTGNELYMRDSGGTVTAGAAGGNGISFWAGDDTPGEAPFRVNYNGSMTATSGTFGCLTIGSDNYSKAGLHGTTGNEEFSYSVNLSPETMMFRGVSNSGTQYEQAETIAFCPNRNPDTTGELYNAAINIIDENGTSAETMFLTAIDTNEMIRAARYEQSTVNARVNSKYAPRYGGTVFTPGLSCLEICFQTSTETWSTYFTKDGYNSTWRFKGMDTGISYITYPTAKVMNTVSQGQIPSDEDTGDYLGYWAFTNSSSIYAVSWTAIAGPNATKKSNVIYIQI